MKAVDYAGLRVEQAQRVADFKAGKTRKLLGIGLTHFTEIVGAGPVKNCDILGMGMFDSCEIRVHPTGSAIARLGTISQGQGHATTFAQIIASEIGLPADSITVEEGDTDYCALRTWHLWQPVNARCRGGDSAVRAQDPRQGPDDRGLSSGSARRTMWNGTSTVSQ